MKSITFKKAFSLTELLIVMVIIGILFAALLPIMTKRRSGDTIANEPVWSFVANNDQKDAFYDPGTTGQTSTAYVGISPDNIASNVKPYSKMVIKTRPNQHMIQFRYGSGNGLFTGAFSMDGSKNIMMGGKIDTRSNNNYFIGGSNNTVAGMGAFSRTLTPASVLALGSNAVMGKQGGSSPSEIVAVGANSGQYMSHAGRNTFIGTNSGRAESATISNTVGIGSNVLGISSSSGNDNVFAGYFAGFAGFDNHDKSINNTILGSTYYGTTAANNTIAGYDSFVGGKHEAKNLSVAGYEACLSMQYNGDLKNPGRRTCLGYGSAKNRGAGGTLTSLETDKYDHIFLGGSPVGFGGRSVLEVHNMIPNSDVLSGKVSPQLRPTVLLNSNLVVRGNLFIPSTDGRLIASSGNPALTQSLFNGGETGGDRCGRRCGPFGRKKYRDAPKCQFLGTILGAIVGLVAGFVTVITGGLAAPLAGAIYFTLWSGGFGATVGTIFNGSDYSRPKDPVSMTWLSYQDSDDKGKSYYCGGYSDQYPTSSASHCPNLNLSDARLKNIGSENIAALEKIMMLVPYNYTFKADKDALAQVGVMAQDLQKIFPDSVSEDKDGYLNIRWDEMFFAVINSVKELNANVNAVTADLQVVEQDTDSVADAQHNIKDRISKLNEKLDSLENNK